ncbi:MAG: hypothetical protein HYV76_00560 [Candidatus Vogelbacteria bacterium]|nr:hypothetical protein [Candidatus Vogelbacteria bacterium]
MQSTVYINFEYFFNLIYQLLFNGGWRNLGMPVLVWLPVIKVIGITIGLIWLALIVYISLRLIELNKKKIIENITQPVVASKDYTEQFERVMKFIDSDNPSDWKLAIIEADTILDALVARMNYPGENLGERLKAIEASDFLTLNQAWEAHKVRNQIAHEPNHQLNKREARATIELYKQVFQEFDYI